MKIYYRKWLAVGLGAVVTLALWLGVAVSLHYHPQAAPTDLLYQLVACIPIAFLTVMAFAGPKRPAFTRRVAIPFLALGATGFTLLGLFLIAIDSGDLIIYIWALLFGLSLAFVIKGLWNATG